MSARFRVQFTFMKWHFRAAQNYLVLKSFKKELNLVWTFLSDTRESSYYRLCSRLRVFDAMYVLWTALRNDVFLSFLWKYFFPWEPRRPAPAWVHRRRQRRRGTVGNTAACLLISIWREGRLNVTGLTPGPPRIWPLRHLCTTCLD